MKKKLIALLVLPAALVPAIHATADPGTEHAARKSGAAAREFKQLAARHHSATGEFRQVLGRKGGSNTGEFRQAVGSKPSAMGVR